MKRTTEDLMNLVDLLFQVRPQQRGDAFIGKANGETVCHGISVESFLYSMRPSKSSRVISSRVSKPENTPHTLDSRQIT